jgi:hypothetical protein
MEWEKLDRVFGRVESALLGLSSKVGIEHPTIESWRWDEPVITLIWLGVDHVRRNIGIHAISEDEIKIEVNAWRDEDRDEGKARVRHWQHRQMRNLKVVNFEVELPGVLLEAYETVKKWQPVDLKQETFVTSGAV